MKEPRKTFEVEGTGNNYHYSDKHIKEELEGEKEEDNDFEYEDEESESDI